ncbi:hypothetical protein OAH94_07275 [Amylibacter sp.]|nr:hypothetical protein [Amylibacter sp.]
MSIKVIDWFYPKIRRAEMFELRPNCELFNKDLPPPEALAAR